MALVRFTRISRVGFRGFRRGFPEIPGHAALSIPDGDGVARLKGTACRRGLGARYSYAMELRPADPMYALSDAELALRAGARADLNAAAEAFRVLYDRYGGR